MLEICSVSSFSLFPSSSLPPSFPHQAADDLRACGQTLTDATQSQEGLEHITSLSPPSLPPSLPHQTADNQQARRESSIHTEEGKEGLEGQA